MAETTTISWTDATFNPWLGCTKVSPACDACYAEATIGENGRWPRVKWGGPGMGAGTRVRTAESTWDKQMTLERKRAKAVKLALATGAAIPPPFFIFVASQADVFDTHTDVKIEWFRDLVALIRKTPHLTYLLLTKRPANITRRYFEACGHEPWPSNAAIGCTVVTQAEANRDIPTLLVAAQHLKPAFVFVSMEPLLERVRLDRISTLRFPGAEVLNALTGVLEGEFGDYCATRLPKLDWVIVGGETDQGVHRARPMDPAWAIDLEEQCSRYGTAFHFKQWGANLPCTWDNDDEGRLTYTIDEEHSEVDYDELGNGRRVEAHGREFAHFHHGNTGRTLNGRHHDARPPGFGPTELAA